MPARPSNSPKFSNHPVPITNSCSQISSVLLTGLYLLSMLSLASLLTANVERSLHAQYHETMLCSWGDMKPVLYSRCELVSSFLLMGSSISAHGELSVMLICVMLMRKYSFLQMGIYTLESPIPQTQPFQVVARRREKDPFHNHTPFIIPRLPYLKEKEGPHHGIPE